MMFSHWDQANWVALVPSNTRSISLMMGLSFKERFRHIPLPLLEEVRALLRDMLEAGAI